MGSSKGCGNCYFRRKEFVGTKGNPKAPIVIVGESPGAVELAKGMPFKGPSGKVLGDCLPPNSVESDFYFTNAMHCLPRKVKDAAVNTRELQQGCMRCRDRLIAEIKAHPREVVVALGNGALWALTGNPNYKITKERGKLFPSDLANRGIVASVHPAFLLYGGGSYRKFKMDIEYALDLAEGGPEKKPIVPTWTVAESEADVRDFIDYTFDQSHRLQDDILGADIETGGFNHRGDEILSLGWCVSPDEVFIVPEGLLETNALTHRRFDVAQRYGGPFKWTWHNGKFDVKFMRGYGYQAGVDHDTMLMSYSMEEQRGYHDLEQVAQDEIGAPDYKDMLKPYLPNKAASYRVIPKPVLNKYLAFDVSNTKQCATKLYRRLCKDDKNYKLYHHVLLHASELLADVETHGMFVDKQRVKENSKHYNAIMVEQAGIINQISQEHGGPPINCNSPIQLSALIYDRLKLSTKRKGTADDVLTRLPQHPAIVALKKYRKAAKAYGTYVKKLENGEHIFDDGRVHSTYLIHGTATGRLSSRNPNMQNQPRGPVIRGQYVAAPGHILCEMDLDQAELRCLAALSKDPELCRIYEEGRKLHKEVSIKLWGEDWVRKHDIADSNDPEYIEAHEQYMITKNLNFGIVYGRTAPSIANDPDLFEEGECSVEEAQVWIDGWAEQFPIAWQYIQRCRLAPVKGQNLVTPFGRRKRAGVVSRERLRDLQNEAANFPHQSIASDITLVSACKVNKPLQKMGIKIVNLIHDAILVELPQDRVLFEEASAYVIEEMQKTPVEWGIDRIPFEADAKLGYRWGDLSDAKNFQW